LYPQHACYVARYRRLLSYNQYLSHSRASLISKQMHISISRFGFGNNGQLFSRGKKKFAIFVVSSCKTIYHLL